MKLSFDLKSPLICKAFTPKAATSISSIHKKHTDFNEYIPHNFSGSNEVLIASKKLATIHRHLLNAKPRRYKSREIHIEKVLESFDFSDKDSDIEFLEPKLEIIIPNSDIKPKDDIKEQKSKNSIYNISPKTTGRKDKAKPMTSLRRYSFDKKKKYSVERNAPLLVRNFDTFVRGGFSKDNMKKYDFSSLRIQGIINK
ncbi:hypothetical protein SteCoe_28323 [Stentor coeruleus]|uniref:Uncharacterized protein n=1 Tax=Stentor coeruleus TaxID=5963 RepID=A0A1R2B8F9_9CILI|nr:hypothetical protein SteCoe_28323 [Stentor coeruleus]